jgi:hypothetical protein
MFERGAPGTARSHTRTAASERRRAECPPPLPTRGHAEAAGLPFRSNTPCVSFARVAHCSQEFAREARRLR